MFNCRSNSTGQSIKIIGGGLFGVFKGLVGSKTLTPETLEGPLEKMREHLIGNDHPKIYCSNGSQNDMFNSSYWNVFESIHCSNKYTRVIASYKLASYCLAHLDSFEVTVSVDYSYDNLTSALELQAGAFGVSLFNSVFDFHRSKNIVRNHCSDPTLWGGDYVLKWVFFLFRQFWPIDIFIVEKC